MMVMGGRRQKAALSVTIVLTTQKRRKIARNSPKKHWVIAARNAVANTRNSDPVNFLRRSPYVHARTCKGTVSFLSLFNNITHPRGASYEPTRWEFLLK